MRDVINRSPVFPLQINAGRSSFQVKGAKERPPPLPLHGPPFSPLPRVYIDRFDPNLFFPRDQPLFATAQGQRPVPSPPKTGSISPFPLSYKQREILDGLSRGHTPVEREVGRPFFILHRLPSGFLPLPHCVHREGDVNWRPSRNEEIFLRRG